MFWPGTEIENSPGGWWRWSWSRSARRKTFIIDVYKKNQFKINKIRYSRKCKVVSTFLFVTKNNIAIVKIISTPPSTPPNTTPLLCHKTNPYSILPPLEHHSFSLFPNYHITTPFPTPALSHLLLPPPRGGKVFKRGRGDPPPFKHFTSPQPMI